jgi:hypothetical protein
MSRIYISSNDHTRLRILVLLFLRGNRLGWREEKNLALEEKERKLDQ